MHGYLSVKAARKGIQRAHVGANVGAIVGNGRGSQPRVMTPLMWEMVEVASRE